MNSHSFFPLLPVLLFTLSSPLLSLSLPPVPRDSCFRLLEYNVENLFDTVHVPGHLDEAFTPQGSHHWNSRRYWRKLGGLARTIAAAGGAAPVDLVALVEVENDSVVRDLARRTRLARSGYDYAVTCSADPRGANVALLYQPARFKPVHIGTLRVAPPHRGQPPTRDVLHVAGETTWGDTLDVLVCHLPSRRGARWAEDYRNAVCRRMRACADSLMRVRARPAVVMTGDFNAGWPEDCLARHLAARLPEVEGRKLEAEGMYVVSHGLITPRGVAGTYCYRGSWCRLDHFVVNGALLGAAVGGSLYGAAVCRIADFGFLLDDASGAAGGRPAPTYRGTVYVGGWSDHLPLLLTLYPATETAVGRDGSTLSQEDDASREAAGEAKNGR